MNMLKGARRAFSLLTVSSRNPAYRIRKATEQDVPVILKYITVRKAVRSPTW